MASDSINGWLNFSAAQTVAESSLGSRHFDPEAMTPDALMFYLSTRMGSIDMQMDSIMRRERTAQQIRSELSAIQTQLAELAEVDDKQADLNFPDTKAFHKELSGHIYTIKMLDPDLGARIEEQLNSAGQIGTTPTPTPKVTQTPSQDAAQDSTFSKTQEEQTNTTPDDATYKTAEVEATKQYLSLVAKDLESGSQMDMIQLQSLMGARQTAIQLATNLVAALNESAKAVVANIG